MHSPSVLGRRTLLDQLKGQLDRSLTVGVVVMVDVDIVGRLEVGLVRVLLDEARLSLLHLNPPE